MHLSAASVWELAIKTGNKKLILTDPLDVYLGKWLPAYQIASVPIHVAHALAVAGLADHHRDPFDRILLAQAIVETMTLVSADSKLSSYSVPILW